MKLPYNRGTGTVASLLAGAWLSLLASLALAGPMDIGGVMAVNEMGAATYSIPIVASPGTGGIEPKLALTYSSQGGNGLLGVGWNLSGLSVITRCPRTQAQDGVRGSVSFDANDRFCLDGQRLVAVTGTYGADGTEYRTERDSFAKILSYGSAGSGPAWFKVWTKSGQVIEFGNTTDSRIEAIKASASTASWTIGSVRAWAQNKVSDTKNNYFTVTYTEDAVNGDFYVQRVDYTGNAAASLTPNNSIQFVYESRPDTGTLYFLGAQLKNVQRLAKIQSYQGTSVVREMRLTYNVSASTARSRIAAIRDCAMPSNVCKPPVSFTQSESANASWQAPTAWSSTQSASFIIDVNGDGRGDLVSIGSDGVYVALSNGTGVDAMAQWVNAFGGGQGYTDQNVTPIFIQDVNGDGLPDIVGLAMDGIYVGINTGTSFLAPVKWISDFGSATAFAWTNMDTYPRSLADVNGDGLPDIVGFRNDGVYVALNTGNAFAAATRWLTDFGTATTTPYANNSAYPRMVLDVNGDGLPDIVGFAANGTYVSYSTGSAFSASTLALSQFGVSAGGWTTQDTYPRTFGDINGDGLPDLIGFFSDGVYVAINYGTNFGTATKWLADFGTATATPYSSQKGFPRYVADVNGDGKADIVGFAANGVQVALSSGAALSPSTQWLSGLGSAAGYGTANARQLADVDGDGFLDAIGILNGTNVARSGRGTPADLNVTIDNGLGVATTVSYELLTNPAIYTRSTGAVFPQMDLTVPMSVVSLLRQPNALGGGYLVNYYQYGGLRADVRGRGMLGFGWQSILQVDSNISAKTLYRQDWPYTGLPSETQKRLPGAGNGGLLGLSVNTYACIDPKTGGACAVAAGNRYFPYVSQGVEANWDVNGAAFPVTSTNYQYDSYGNATQITYAADDGVSKTTTNTYTNDTTNWFLGRLLRAQVASTVSGTATPINVTTPFIFNATISSNTQNYNLQSAAVAAGWDQIAPLQATVTVNSGVVVSSTTTTLPAFDTGSGFPSGSTLALTIQSGAYIAGRGGKGGAAGVCGSTGGLGGVGGTAFTARVPISVTNNGTIGGGGGGGGGGGNSWSAGGGGAGYGDGGVGLGGNQCTGYISANGAIGGQTAGGAGGVYYGGAGGALGAAGGAAPTIYPGAGGAAGAAVTGNSNITWVAAGTRLGNIIADVGASAVTVTSATPNAGPLSGDVIVTLAGSGFQPGATVTIGGNSATGCTVNRPTRMSCIVPAGSVGSKDIVVTSGTQSGTLAGGFTYQAFGISSVTPNVGSFAGGTSITVNGSGFAPGATVSIGGVAATGCVANSSSSLTCATPPNTAGAKNVTVSLDSNNATLSNGFTYQNLSLLAISPNSGLPDGGATVNLSGTGFVSGTTVTIGGTVASCNVTSATAMSCVTPPGSLGAKDVVVSLAGTSSTMTGGFTYQTNFVFNATVSANTQNYNLKAAAIAAGWNQTAPIIATITINSGVIVSSATTATAAFDTGAGFPTGSSLSLTIQSGAYIVGRGGKGGNAGSCGGYGATGGTGGPALNVQAALSVTNNGTIGGGGGGGGGGGNSWSAGGGGAGYGDSGIGVGGAQCTGYTSNNGAAGSLTGGGGGGVYYGGAGGALGASGGGAPTIQPGGGGAPGAAVVGNTNVTWVSAGSRLGALQ